MQTKTFSPGDKIELKTKEKKWIGYALESHDPQIILLKLNSGYNIGIRENEILDAKIIEKSEITKKEKPKIEKNKDLPNVALIITGGTISSRLDPKSGAVISTDAEEILHIAPELKNICNPIVSSPFMKFSENMSYTDWKKLAEICEKHLNDRQIDGIIITHGTDFLHYTSAALSFFIQNPNKPIALTYSQRSVDRASTDAAMNLICAARYATSDIAEIALVGHENDSDNSCIAMPARSTRKMHTSKRAAFKIVNDTPIARITPEKIDILKTFNARSSNKPKIDTKFNDLVATIKITPGQDPEILDFYKKQGYKGLILEVAGIGQIPGKTAKHNWLPKIKKLIQDGMTICATPQTIFGSLNLNIYSTGRDLQKTGVIPLGDMTSEAAMIKLSWVLGHKTWNPQEKMLK